MLILPHLVNDTHRVRGVHAGLRAGLLSAHPPALNSS
jgi:hypothetical protein